MSSETINWITLQGLERTAGAHHGRGKGLRYHNKHHVDMMLTALMYWVDSRDCPFDQRGVDILHMAAAWHDAVYVPGAAPGYNESRSAEEFQSACLSMGFSDTEQMNWTIFCILQTAVSVHLLPNVSVTRESSMREYKSAAIRDLDLVSLALTPVDEFIQQQRDIASETMRDLATLEDAMFLRGLVERAGGPFRLEYFKAKYGKQAQENLNAFIDYLTTL